MKGESFYKMILLYLAVSFNFLVPASGQSTSTSTDTIATKPAEITTFLHIKNKKVNWRGWIQPWKMILYIDSAEFKWTAEARPIANDSLGYLVKVKIPQALLSANVMLHCKATLQNKAKNGFDTVSYGGVVPGRIELKLISKPQRAEVYLVPRRTWMNNIMNSWKQNPLLLDEFIVDSEKTDTRVNIDETVYIVIFKLGSKYLIRTHYTKPKSIEPFQKVSVDF
jgi:hypothetical protein